MCGPKGRHTVHSGPCVQERVLGHFTIYRFTALKLRRFTSLHYPVLHHPNFAIFDLLNFITKSDRDQGFPSAGLIVPIVSFTLSHVYSFTSIRSLAPSGFTFYALRRFTVFALSGFTFSCPKRVYSLCLERVYILLPQVGLQSLPWAGLKSLASSEFTFFVLRGFTMVQSMSQWCRFLS